ncbi:MAG TPA: rhamnogalacturonan acetylesterase [Blastocatellia bacterium]|nr:rhamnogalacturonan acetylesterase [Blastocatellia bacterium]
MFAIHVTIRKSCLAMALLVLSGVASYSAPQTPAPATSTPAVPNPAVPALVVVGDSTANNKANGARGWGDPLVEYFDPGKINVVNRARAGRSSRTFITEGLWARVLAELKPGDFVLIQFGHNDGGPLDSGRARGSLPGTGAETQEITTPAGTKEIVHTYGWYLRQYIADARARNAIPIILSLTVRNIWKDGKVERGSGRFGEWAAEIAGKRRVDFVDLTTIVANRYDEMGEERVKELFAGDHTHTNPGGADLNAASVVAGLRALTNSKLARFLSKKGSMVPVYKGVR